MYKKAWYVFKVVVLMILSYCFFAVLVAVVVAKAPLLSEGGNYRFLYLEGG